MSLPAQRASLRQTTSPCGTWWGVGFVLLTGLWLNLPAAIPQAAKDDPRYKLGYLVVTHYAGVDTNGVSDSLAGLQAAVNDAYSNNLAALFPSGTYLISDTLRCRAFHLAAGTNTDGSIDLGANPCQTYAYVLQGSTLGSRPAIKLVNAPAGNFDNTNNVRPLLMYRLYQSTNYPNLPQVDPPDANILDAPVGYNVNVDYLFEWELRNLDFDCNGHAGAVGVVFPADQGAVIANVRINATNAYAGFYGLPGASYGAVNIEVNGGRYGIRTGTVAGVGAAGSTVLGARLLGQTVATIEYDDFVPLTMMGFQISKAAAPVLSVKSSAYTGWNAMSLLDGSIRITGSPSAAAAVSNSAAKNLYLRNVYVNGATNLVKSGSRAPLSALGPWSRIDEYSYCDQRTTSGTGGKIRTITTRSMIDGVINTVEERVALATGNCGSPPADLVERHYPGHGVPTYEGPGSPPTVLVTDPPFSAIPGDSINDTRAIQQAIDAASAAGHGRVFIPKFNPNGSTSGAFLLTNTLTLRSNTVFFGASKSYVSELRTASTWRPTIPTPIVQTVDDAKASTYLGNLAINVDVSLYRNPFTYYHWRAGPASETYYLSGDSAYEYNPPTNANYYTALYFSGNAGGRHYFSLRGNAQRENVKDGYPSGFQNRTLRITNTFQPLWLYGWNLECGLMDSRRYDAEILNSANIRWLHWKREGQCSMLLVSNCTNFALYSAGDMRDPLPGGAANLEITGTSTNLLLANVLVQSTTDTNPTYFTLKEFISGQPTNAIRYPEGVSLYKRGSIDDGLMRLPPGMPEALAVAPVSSAQVNLAWPEVPGETGWRLERKTGTNAFVLLSNVTAGVTNYSDFTVLSTNTYTYRLSATNSAGASPPSWPVSVTTPANQPPALAPISNVTVNAGITLNLTSTASDPESPPQILTFNLLSAPTNATLNPTSGVFSWRSLAAQANSTNPVVVTVTDNGTPNLSTTQSFSIIVNPVARPTLFSPLISNGLFRLGVAGDYGPDYTLLASTNLTNWGPLTQTNTPRSPFWLMDTSGIAAPQRFYRVLMR